MSVETVTTANVPAGERLAYWNDITGKAIAPMRVEARNAASFSARMDRKKLRDCELLSLRSSPAHVIGTPGQQGAGVLNLQLQRRGTTLNFTGGREAVLREGDFVLYDPSQPFWLDFERTTEAIVLRLPRAKVEERMPQLRSRVGMAIDGRRGAGAVLSNFLRTVAMELERDEQGQWADSLGEVVWPLLQMVYAPVAGDVAASRAAVWRAKLFQLIDADICDPELDVNLLAERAGLSARYIQMLFSEIGVTPRAFIKSRRLELAASRLEREGMGTMITSVAYDLGFNCLSSFCRSFKSRFGVSPDAFRRGCRP